MKQYLIVVALFLSTGYCFAKDSKEVQKNMKAVEKEEHQFQKDLRKNSDTAVTYLNHANNLAAITSESGRASGFYLLALKYDAANAAIYKSYGRYLFDRMRDYNDSKAMLEKGLALAPNDADMKNYLASVSKILASQDEDARLRSFGATTARTLNPDTTCKTLTKFDSLKLLIASPGNRFNYQSLFNRFISDDTTLTPQDMYMMVVGYSTEKTYNPFNYNEILEMRMMQNHDIDAAISKGIELTQTNPLNPTLNREIMYCYRKKGQSETADKYLNRIKQYFSGVLFSGNGTCDKPYISLWSREEYNFINYIGYKATENHFMGQCAGQMAEVIDMIDPVTQKTEPINFNVALIYMQAVGK